MRVQRAVRDRTLAELRRLDADFGLNTDPLFPVVMLDEEEENQENEENIELAPAEPTLLNGTAGAVS